ncbi:MAG: hypothetical protein HQM08_11265 [Candidatus Riflebacteria bacterium]|nr:hypothetical protein [Candidatus Riflebacteria bacterium]
MFNPDLFIRFKSQKAKSVNIAGDFNEWCGTNKAGKLDLNIGKMEKQGNNLWIFPISGIKPGTYQYKFIIDGIWEANGNRVFKITESDKLVDPTGGIKEVVLEKFDQIKLSFSNQAIPPTNPDDVKISILPSGIVKHIERIEGVIGEGDSWLLNCESIDFKTISSLEIIGLADQPITRPIHLDGLFQKNFISKKRLGAFVEGDPEATTFRLFAPRADNVILLVYEDSELQLKVLEKKMIKDSDGVWETSIHRSLWGNYYGYRVFGNRSEFDSRGEGFDSSKIWPDPYSKASVFHTGPSILIDSNVDRFPFKGWSDQNFQAPSRSDLIVWECSIRDLTTHSTANIDKEYKGKYMGLISSEKTECGIGHMKDLGINAAELLPVYEFDDNPPGSYHWGYMPSLFFAPEASYASNPYGKQFYEFKELVNTFHRNQIAVILDVVYNHSGAPQVLMGMDKQYFYRHDFNLGLLNFSGCGNDFKSELPMGRRLILDSLKYWVEEFHIDGFRFDLAELIDLKTLREIENELQKVKPGIILIAEPWSFRGTLKGKLKKTEWTCWNDDFRNRIKEAALGRLPAKELEPILKGSVELWTSSPLECVNYVESHDDFTLTDYLCHSGDRNGSNPSPVDIKRNLFCAAAIFLSPGIPMIAQGQEMLRSKFGNHNSYNAGDGINAVNYLLKAKYSEVYSFYKSLIAFRSSQDCQILRRLEGSDCKTTKTLFSIDQVGIGTLWEKRNFKPILTLFNPDNSKSAEFAVKVFGKKWRRKISTLMGQGEKIFREPLFANEKGELVITLPPLCAEAWVSEER